MILRCIAVLVLALAFGPAVAPAAAADSAKARYERALDRERVLRDTDRKPTLKQLRSAIHEYEGIVRRYPRSGYCDNALWQAGNLALLAYERFGQAADKRTGVRLLTQLKEHYPSSSLVAQVRETIRQTGQTGTVREVAPPLRTVPRPAPTFGVTAEDLVASDAATADKPFPAESVEQSPVSTARIRDIKRTPLPDGTRVSIELDGEASYRSERLDGPARVFFDLKGAMPVSALQDATLRFTDDVVREIRLGRHPRNTTRVVMDMAGVESYSVFTLYDPFRLVIDFKATVPPNRPAATHAAAPPAVVTTAPPAASPAVQPASLAALPAPKAPEPAVENKTLPSRAVAAPVLNLPSVPSVNTDGKFSLARQLGLGISRIVIDAGHGGHDPGAHANGVKEADLVLDVAQRLAKLLQKQTVMEVVMTRDSDVYIPLEERTAIANREGADLFLSIHANAARNVQARGVETYFLNFASNPEAEAVAARENSASGRTMHSLPDIVRAIALNNKIDESRDFASAVQRAMVQRLSARNKQLKNLGVKQAPFVVLIGAGMPSVLAEISFLTNRQEAQMLKTGAYRQQIAEALFDAVIRYQQSVKKLKVVTSQLGVR